MSRILLILITAAVICGCGIPSIPYIDPPEVPSPNTTDLFDYEVYFENADKNNPVYFYGYSLYYRFFSTEEELDDVVEDLVSADDRSDLLNESYNFLYRMTNSTGSDNEGTPLTIPIDENDRNDDFKLTLSFKDDIAYSTSESDDESGLFGTVITFGSETMYLGRYINQNRLEEDVDDYVNRSFKDAAFSEDDADLPNESEFSFGEDDTIYLSVYVLSFGRDESSVPIYSEPVNLGKFSIPVSTD